MFNTGKMVLCLALGSLLSVQSTATAMTNSTPQIVASLSQNSSEFKSYWDGASFFCGSPKDGTGYQKFGDRAYQKMEYKGKSAELNSFQQQGECWTCVIDGILYQRKSPGPRLNNKLWKALVKLQVPEIIIGDA